MIASQNVLIDYIFHAIFLVLFGMFVRASVDMTSQVYIMMALLLAGLVVLVNRTFYPGLRLFIDYGSVRGRGRGYGCICGGPKIDAKGMLSCPCASQQRDGY